MLPSVGGFAISSDGCFYYDDGRQIANIDNEAGVSYEKLPVSIEHHFTQNFSIRKITLPTDTCNSFITKWIQIFSSPEPKAPGELIV